MLSGFGEGQSLDQRTSKKTGVAVWRKAMANHLWPSLALNHLMVRAG